MKISKKQKKNFFLMSRGSFNPKIRFLGQKVCPVARSHTDTHTHRVTTVSTLSGFQNFSLQPIIKDRPNCQGYPWWFFNVSFSLYLSLDTRKSDHQSHALCLHAGPASHAAFGSGHLSPGSHHGWPQCRRDAGQTTHDDGQIFPRWLVECFVKEWPLFKIHFHPFSL